MNIVIIVTTYNSAATIVEVVRSLRNQRDCLQDVAFIRIADDGSTDQTLKIIRAEWDGCAVPLDIIKRDKNLGEWQNVNDAIESLPKETEWILKLHADNPLKPHWLATMVDAIRNASDDVATICSSYDSHFEDGFISTGEDEPGQNHIKVKGGVESIRGTLLKGCWWHNCGCAIRLSAFRDIGKFSTKWKQKGDWEWLLRALQCGWGVIYIPKTLFIYTQTETNLSSYAFKNDIDLRESSEIFRGYIKEAHILDVLKFYFAHGCFALRRLARAMLRLDVERFFKTLRTLMLLIQNMLSSLIVKISARFRSLIPAFFQEILRCPLYVWKARSLAAQAVNERRSEILFDLVQASRFSPIQIKSEILALCEEVRKKNPQVLCEIGAASGGSLFLLSRCAADKAEYIVVDIAISQSKKLAFPMLSMTGQQVICLCGDSHLPETAAKAQRAVNGKKFDVLFIDGDHSYEGVKRDFELFSALVRQGGLIVFHDIVPDFFERFGRRKNADSGGVPKFWAEIRMQYGVRTREIIANSNQDGFGIGLLDWPG